MRQGVFAIADLGHGSVQGRLEPHRRRLGGRYQVQNAVSLVVALWLLGILFAYNVAPSRAWAAQVVALVWIWPIAFGLGGSRFAFAPVFRAHPAVLAAVVTFLAITLPQAAFSTDPAQSLSFWLVTLVGTAICAGLWSIISGRELLVLRAYSLLGLAALTGILLLTYEGVGRFDTIRNPNAIGLIVISLVASAFAFRSIVIRFALVTVGLVTILAANSRSAMVGSAIILLVAAALRWRLFSASRKLGVVVVVVALVIVGVTEYMNVIGQTIDQLFLLNDPYRGIGTGFTRRRLVWQETLGLFLDHPWFGVGYRTHQAYLTYGTSSHNGYLALLSEVGVLGALPVLALIVLGIRRLFRTALAGSVHAGIGLSLACAYLFIAFFERFMINFGNPTSVLFLIFVLMPAARSGRGRSDGGARPAYAR